MAESVIRIRAETSGVRASGGVQLAPPALCDVTLLELPAPPSVNKMYRNVPGRGRVRSAEYVDWAAMAGWKLRAQHPSTIAGNVIVVIGVEREARMMGADIDNRIKALLDLLVEHGVIEDDKRVAAVAAAWNPAKSGLARIAIAPVCDGLGLTYHFADSKGALGGWFIDAPDDGDDDGCQPS